MDDTLSQKEIELMPFIHQVGGHSFMLSLDESTVCKALIPRELQFYKTLPGAVRKFVPNFFGVVQVRTVFDPEGYLHFLSSPPPNYRPQTPAKPKIRFKRTGSIELLATDGIYHEDVTATEEQGLNPWVLTCHKQNMDRWNLASGEAAKMEEIDLDKDFIVLENLVNRFKYPCILDLKMGTRQYGDAASLAKKQSKMVKVVSTTSAKLGLRLCGMQVYQTQTERYLCRNKFYGRTLSVAGFQQALVQFLHNGDRLRTDVLAVLTRKLEELALVLNRLEAIRFYTTSLLLLYEGEDSDSDTEGIPRGPLLEKQDSLGSAGRRGSDSDLGKKTSNPDNTPDKDEPSPGSQTKRRTSSAANLDTSTLSETSSNSSSSSTIFEDCSVRSKARAPTSSFRGRSFSTKSDPGGGRSPEEPRVDVRIIDFAHSTHKELDDLVVYSGPDRGFLFGIETLIGLLKAIETDYG